MTEEDLTLTRFTELLDVHGADLQRWPEPVRDAARALAASDAQAAELLQQARQLDDVLDSWESLPPSTELQRAVAEIPLRHPREAGAKLPWFLGAFWRTALSAATVVALGCAAGSLGNDAPQAPAAPDQLAALDPPELEATEEETDELDELMELAFLAEASEEEWP
ncbi:MAG: hypothetical protein OXT09_17475 [Myxococcales bacterium]|nr:hypothetical protein [Myxococcales bacterium]